MNSINFKANYIMPATIKENKQNKFNEKQVAFVELDENNFQDVQAMYDISCNWNCFFAKDIYTDFTSINKEANNHICAVTTQEKDYNNIDKDKIIGLVDYTTGIKYKDGNTTYVNYLQTKPSLINKNLFNFNKKYKNIGKAMIDCVKHLSADDYITLSAVPDAVPFYEKSDFKKDLDTNSTPFIEMVCKK